MKTLFLRAARCAWFLLLPLHALAAPGDRAGDEPGALAARYLNLRPALLAFATAASPTPQPADIDRLVAGLRADSHWSPRHPRWPQLRAMIAADLERLQREQAADAELAARAAAAQVAGWRG